MACLIPVSIYIHVFILHYVLAQLCPTLCDPATVAHQAPLSMVFPRQEYWSKLPLTPPRDLPNTGIKSTSPALAGGFFTTEPPGKPSHTTENTIFKCYYFSLSLAPLQRYRHCTQDVFPSSELKAWSSNCRVPGIVDTQMCAD